MRSMKSIEESIAQKLQSVNIKPSVQRIKILEYLAGHPCHPNVDIIYSELHKDMPTLSRTTVYNTLKLFVDSKLLRVITIEDNEIRYEYNMNDHGHFKCGVCHSIYDFDIDIDSFNSYDLNGFKINDKNVYFKGICNKCNKMKGQNNE